MMRRTMKVAALALLALTASAASAQLVINEIDYDQDGTDSMEFVEILNVGGSDEDLSLWALQLVNGTGGGATIYDEIFLPAVNLAPGDYYVVCGDAANVANCDLDDDPDTNFIQNGGPDAVGLAFKGVVMDAVSYEGDSAAPYTEGSGVGLEDNAGNAMSGISRFPDGTDTDMNNLDLSPRCITPGEANIAADTDCDGGDELTLEFAGECPGEITITVSGGTPSGAGGLLFSPLTGTDALAGGPCAGTVTGLSSPSVLTVLSFDVDGMAVLARTAPSAACGLNIQVVDGSSCEVSNVTTVGP